MQATIRAVSIRHQQRTLAILVVVIAAIAPSCGKKRRTARTPFPAPQTRAAAKSPGTANKTMAVAVGYTEEGIASWYGVPYHGRPAADGEIYNMETMVAAHRLMPFNTWLRVTNLSNGKTAQVRVIDRGPFVDGRIIDLSKAAARQIDLLGPGVGQVRLEVIASPMDIPSNDLYSVQVGAFSQQANAERARLQYLERYGAAQLALKQGATPLWKVLVGKENSVDAAQRLADQIRSESGIATFVVRLDQTKPSVPETTVPPPSSTPTSPAPPSQLNLNN